MNEPWLSHMSMGDPFRVLACLFPHSRGLKPTATYGMPLQGMKQSLITIISVADDPEIRDHTYEILHLGCANRHRVTGPLADSEEDHLEGMYPCFLTISWPSAPTIYSIKALERGDGSPLVFI